MSLYVLSEAVQTSDADLVPLSLIYILYSKAGVGNGVIPMNEEVRTHLSAPKSYEQDVKNSLGKESEAVCRD